MEEIGDTVTGRLCVKNEITGASRRKENKNGVSKSKRVVP